MIIFGLPDLASCTYALINMLRVFAGDEALCCILAPQVKTRASSHGTHDDLRSPLRQQAFRRQT